MKSLVALLVLVALALIPSSHSCGSCPSPSPCHSCPSGWIRWQSNCYKYHSEPKLNFDDAEALCSEFVPFQETCSCQTAHLASIESAEENTFLLEEWRKVRGPTSSTKRIHIGYTDQAEEGNWQWVDGSSCTYTNWDSVSNEPNNSGGNEDCGVMWNEHNDNGDWNDGPCSYLNPFFCKFRLY
ncbi:Alpha-N-acetylgalactosamine-specific lectin [Holothuria leucospilota]|uniref:Alpha-N-acetylgalactosamine-specific lectin n=1 Tax=Holothuria leucospilota TaxID=206669 RepID=A0A9Q0YLI6_HOLLE|nr:Alpha-N-acetylgalactosamine-specific lectin [Holothuria leucospilota]